MPVLKGIETKYLNFHKDFKRKTSVFKSSTLLVVLTLVLFISLLPGFAAKGGGFNPQVQQLYSSKKRFTESCHNQANAGLFKSCMNFSGSGKEEIDLMLVGDSHAAGFTTATADFAKARNLRYFISTNSGCPGISANKIQDGQFQDCKKYAKFISGRIEDLKPKAILISGRWANYLNSFPRVAGEAPQIDNSCLINSSHRISCPRLSNTSSIFYSSFRSFLLTIPANSKVILLLDYPEFTFDFESCERLYRLEPKCFIIAKDDYLQRQDSANKFFESLSMSNLFLVSGEEYFCNRTTCNSFIDGRNLYYDSHHLNTFGSARYFDQIISKYLSPV
jgi:hypothetical protein